MKSVAFFTLGCKVNQYETESIIDSFVNKGYEIKAFDQKADVYVVNTCSVTALADRKSRTALRKARKQNPDATIVVCGCYSQTHPEDVKEIPEADIILGNTGKENIVSLVEEKENRFFVTDIMEERIFAENSVSGHSDKTRAFMKIQDGCDNYCAYCIIPYARGHIRSRDMESIVREAKKFVKNGYKEIVLTGIHITSYGKETGDKNLLDVLKMLHSIEGIRRIRLGSLEYNDALIDVANHADELPLLCNHFHVSLQSGCDETLKRMRRRYTTSEYFEGISLLRKAFPNCAITTDIMVGFPGETQEEFEKSLAFAKKAEFSKMHIFPYSVREGTKAADMPNQLNKEEKKKRASLMENTDRENAEKFMKSQRGTFQSVLFETKDGDYYIGHTTNYLTVKVKSDMDLHNEILQVKITGYSKDTLTGEIIY
ncbi:MAG: tRNA (N(6)-L-threonylcarbamoyladenosine(37)-C(2))-methylthiotransferase MtaB [Clostridia bacterium]|nr:tRNA (N(6)-L-threonylcarbamoyladenosine(37)-C(2))-methylthiotransferase MtaB [Clostridia bacterium]